MIAFRDFLPLLQLPDGRTIAFDRAWLIRVLGVAADRAGSHKWWMAEHIAASVEVWLSTFTDVNTITTDRFVKAVREALDTVGFPRIGFFFEQAAPFHRISLLEVAQKAGNGFELGFFRHLDEHILEVIHTGSTYCELHHLDPCVTFLCNRKPASRQCTSLRHEIVAYARTATTLRNERENQLFLYVE